VGEDGDRGVRANRGARAAWRGGASAAVGRLFGGPGRPGIRSVTGRAERAARGRGDVVGDAWLARRGSQ
jgi:hypothetical protein